ncbi:MAG: hypothetical protein JWR74_3201 [Polaromonas sp.]|nr:hypothetical protein [Polaromonas sp.]
MSARQAILAALPGTAATLAQQTGYARSFVGRELRNLCRTERAHIGDWARTTGNPAPVYVAGRGQAAPKPAAAKTETQKSREYRARVGRPVRVHEYGVLPAALMAQQRVFALGGVWA